MQYIILDLEWNATYARKLSKVFSEIIELGAAKYNSDLDCVDTFSCIIRTQIGHKLRGSIKSLTNLTNEDILTGLPFTKAFALFRKWIGKEETAIITWGNCDIRVLLENFVFLNGVDTIPFLEHYLDLQRYYHLKEGVDFSQQIGLCTAAAQLGLNPESYIHHRALGDSLLTGDIFERIYDKELFEKELETCDERFYDKLLYKPKIIKNIANPYIDKKRLLHFCEICKQQCVRKNMWTVHGQYFKANFHCPGCGANYEVKLRLRRMYDGIEYKKVVSVLDEKN